MSASNEEVLTMEERLQRLRLLFHDEDAWQQSNPPVASLIVPQPALGLTHHSINSEGDEKVLAHLDQCKGALQQSVRFCEIDQSPTGFRDPQPFETEEEAPKGEAFCSFNALIGYPQKHITLAEREIVAHRFFEANQIYEHPWDFFYIYPYSDLTHKPILLVSLSQVQVFLALINSELGTKLMIPENAAKSGLLVEFLLDRTPYPTYIGQLTELEMAEICKMRIPSALYTPQSDLKHPDAPTESALHAFRGKIVLLLRAERKSKGSKKDKKKVRYQQKQSWNNTVKRVQRYLGIREARKGHDEAFRSAFQGSEFECTESEQAIASTPSMVTRHSAFDISAAIPFVQEDSVVFISVDIEAYEHAHNLVTEIGVATLDTADITNVAAGEGAKNWIAAVRARHFRIKENGHYVNKDFVHGCPDKFLFGTSEWIKIKDAPREIANCFKHPFSKLNTEPDVSLPKRNIILVGHNVKADISFLRQIGYDVRNLSNLKEIVDTVNMYQALSRDTTPRGLGSILANLGISGWHLHNAGNDATYTLQAMLAISVQALVAKLNRKARALEIDDGTGEVDKERIENEWDSERAWSSTGEGSDGGDAVLAFADSPAPKKANSKV